MEKTISLEKENEELKITIKEKDKYIEELYNENKQLEKDMYSPKPKIKEPTNLVQQHIDNVMRGYKESKHYKDDDDYGIDFLKGLLKYTNSEEETEGENEEDECQTNSYEQPATIIKDYFTKENIIRETSNLVLELDYDGNILDQGRTTKECDKGYNYVLIRNKKGELMKGD